MWIRYFCFLCIVYQNSQQPKKLVRRRDYCLVIKMCRLYLYNFQMEPLCWPTPTTYSTTGSSASYTWDTTSTTCSKKKKPLFFVFWCLVLVLVFHKSDCVSCTTLRNDATKTHKGKSERRTWKHLKVKNKETLAQ